MRKAAGDLIRFGDVELDVQNLSLTVGGENRALEPKSFRLLQFLVENPGRAVSKEEILAAVWQDTFVTDNALTRAITQVRKALNDDAKQPRYIETVPTVGYRFVGEFREPAAAEAAASAPAVPRRGTSWMLAVGLAVAAAVAVLMWMTRTPAKLASAGFRHTEQFSYGQGLDVNAAFSPDGKLIAYASDRGGSYEIYVRALEPSAQELQITNNGHQNLYPAFSPDGQWVVFSSAKTPGLFRVPTLGGTVRRLTEFGTHPAWSPDGSQIVFVSHGSATLSTTDYYWPPDSTLWLVSAEGGTPRQITSHNKPEGGQTFPSWSPDGKEIRFVNYFRPKASVWTYRLSDGALENRFSSAGTTFGSATFSRDSRSIFYVESNLNGNIGIWRLRLNPRTLKPESQPEPVFRPSVGVPRDLSLSPDGRRLLFSAVLGTSQLLVQAMSGKQTAGEPSLITRATSFRYSQAKWFPDSQSVVYVNWRTGQLPQVWQVKVDGSQPAAVSPDSVPQFYPSARPDGESVAFVDQPAEGRFRLRLASLTDGSVQTLAESATPFAQANIAADNSAIVFHEVGPVMHVFKMDLKTGVRTRMTDGPVSSGYTHFSPDSKWISLQYLMQGATEIAILPAAGGTPEVLWKEPGRWFLGGWTADSENLLVAGDDGGGWALYTLSRQTRRMERLTKSLPSRMYMRYPELSPDGKHIVYEFNESKGNVFLAELQ